MSYLGYWWYQLHPELLCTKCFITQFPNDSGVNFRLKPFCMVKSCHPACFKGFSSSWWFNAHYGHIEFWNYWPSQLGYTLNLSCTIIIRNLSLMPMTVRNHIFFVVYIHMHVYMELNSKNNWMCLIWVWNITSPLVIYRVYSSCYNIKSIKWCLKNNTTKAIHNFDI